MFLFFFILLFRGYPGIFQSINYQFHSLAEVKMQNGFFNFSQKLNAQQLLPFCYAINKFFFVIFDMISQMCGSDFNNRTDAYRAKDGQKEKSLYSVRVIKCEYENIKLLLQQKTKTRFGFFFCTLKICTRVSIYTYVRTPPAIHVY